MRQKKGENVCVCARVCVYREGRRKFVTSAPVFGVAASSTRIFVPRFSSPRARRHRLCKSKRRIVVEPNHRVDPAILSRLRRARMSARVARYEILQSASSGEFARNWKHGLVNVASPIARKRSVDSTG